MSFSRYKYQVGGHSCMLYSEEEGGMILKPLFVPEESAYKEFGRNNGSEANQMMQAFIPKYYGTRELPHEAVVECVTRQPAFFRFSRQVDKIPVRGTQFIALGDMARGMKRPCVIDLKLGTRQHGDDAPPAKVESMMRKCRESTSELYGVRLSGMIVWCNAEQRHVFIDKYIGRHTQGFESLRDGLFVFLRQDGTTTAQIRVDIVRLYLEKLRALLAILQTAFPYRMYSASLLLVYDGDCSCSSTKEVIAEARVIDFAHIYALEPGREKDDGVIKGVQTIISVLESLLSSPPSVPITPLLSPALPPSNPLSSSTTSL